MTNRDAWAVAKGQLALDLGCDPALFEDNKNHVVVWQDSGKGRKYSPDTPMLEIAVCNSKLVAAAGEAIFPAVETALKDFPAEWLFTPKPLRMLEKLLEPVGYELGMIHHYYLPQLPCSQVPPIMPVQWYDHSALQQFRGDDRWKEAIAFGPYSPDILGVAAVDGTGAPVGMAACSEDGERLWQIGINVLPEYRGRGLAVNLTALLRDEILHRGAVPFYGTAESHILSQKVARKAGFVPAFAYLYASPKKGS